MGVEIERKFLVKKERWDAVKKEGKLYRQGYMLRDDNKTIRVRVVAGEEGFLTIKGKASGILRPEYDYNIPLRDAEELLNQFCDAVISKIRFRILVENKWWEVDEFLEDNEGLIVAEIELQSETETFVLPDWIDKEVTNDPLYYNSQLSVNPYKNWR